MKGSLHTAHTRLRIISAFFILLALILAVKLYFVQVVYGDDFSERAEHQYVKRSSDSFDRGAIYFTDKDGKSVSAATLKSGFTLAINPSLIQDSHEAYEKLSSVVALDAEDFYFRAGKKDDPYEEVAQKLTEEQAKKIEDMDIEGIQLYKEKWRFYPGENLSSHVLGFVGYKGDELTGRYGVEEYYNDILTRNGEHLYVNFFAEMFSHISDTIIKKNSGRAGDVYLTIEPTVQMQLEKELEEVKNTWSSKTVAGIVMDPKTGEIFAMALKPDFDPNTYGNTSDIGVFTNTLVQGVYEIGSIIKPLTVAAGLDAGVITPQTTYDDKGTIVVDGRRISNYDLVARGVVPMQEILNQSLNLGVSFIVSRLGNEKFSDYFENFGLREKTGIDLPSEASGLTNNLDSKRDVEHFTASFGQGIALSPIATVRALSVLGNGGYLVTPHITKKIDYDVGLTKEVKVEQGRQVLKPETSEEITRMLVRVVDEALQGGNIKMEHYSVAAKTGTAQIPKPGGGYYDDRYLHSFFGYFPAYDPKFLIFMMNIEPRGAQYASETLTPPFADLTKFLINYYEIPPDR